MYTDGLKRKLYWVERSWLFTTCPEANRGQRTCGRALQSVVPLADGAVGNLQQWLLGTSIHGVSRDQLQVYLDEFVFRHNRRKTPTRLSKRCSDLGLGISPLNTRRYGVHPT